MKVIHKKGSKTETGLLFMFSAHNDNMDNSNTAPIKCYNKGRHELFYVYMRST